MKYIIVLAVLLSLVAQPVFGGLFDIFDSEPSLSSAQKEWHIYHRTVGTDDPNYPLEIQEDGYKMIKAYTKKARKRGEREYPEKDMVEWGWKMTIKNKSNNNVGIEITYELFDEDSFEITKCYNYEYYSSSEVIEAGKTKTLQHTCTMEYEDADRVANSSWTIQIK